MLGVGHLLPSPLYGPDWLHGRIVPWTPKAHLWVLPFCLPSSLSAASGPRLQTDKRPSIAGLPSDYIPVPALPLIAEQLINVSEPKFPSSVKRGC